MGEMADDYYDSWKRESDGLIFDDDEGLPCDGISDMGSGFFAGRFVATQTLQFDEKLRRAEDLLKRRKSDGLDAETVRCLARLCPSNY